MDIEKLSTTIAKELYKSGSFTFNGEVKKKTTSIQNVFTDLGVVFPGINKLTKGQLLDLSEAVVSKIKFRQSKANKTTSELTENALKNGLFFTERTNADNMFVFNKVERCLSDIDPRNILRKMPKDIREDVLINMPMGEVVFDPYRPEPVIPVYDSLIDGEYFKLNQYVPPEWQTAYPDLEGKDRQLPKVLVDLFTALIPDADERDMFYSWTGHAIAGRHLSYLHLRGSRGNGKTITAKLIGCLTGYSYLAKSGIIKDGFNADLRGKKAIIIDDDPFIGTREGELARKKLNNSSQTINEKHIQTKKSERNHASYIICSNPSDRFYSSHDERKMVILNLSEENINKVLSNKMLSFLDGLWRPEDEDYNEVELKFLARTGHFMLDQHKKGLYPEDFNYLGGCFWDDVINSLGAFKKLAVEMLISGESDVYSYAKIVSQFELQGNHKSNVVRLPNLVRFLTHDFTYKGEKILKAHNIKEKTLTPIDKYRSSSLAFKEDEDEDEGFDL